MTPEIFLVEDNPSVTRELLVCQQFDLNLHTSRSLDQLIFAESTFGIDDAKKLIAFSSKRPLAVNTKLALILKAEVMTREAQNALLKTLEEPPDYLKLILVTNNTDSFLSTVMSRCVLVRSHKDPPQSVNKPELLEKLAACTSTGQKITLADQFNSDANKAKNVALELARFFRQQMLAEPTATNLYNLTLCLYVKKLLKANTNPKLSLDYLLMNVKLG